MPLWNSRLSFRRVDNIQRRTAEHVEWYPSALCPCSESGDPNRADPNHDACRGTGHITLRDQGRTILANVAKFDSKLYVLDSGMAAPGDIVVSPLARDPVLISQWDTLRLPGWERGEPYEGELIQRRLPGIGTTATLTYEPKILEQCFWVEDELVHPLALGIDFLLVRHTFTWLTTSPEVGTYVSVKYRPIMEYVVVEPPQVRYERGSDIGQYLVARKKHLVQLNSPVADF